MRKAEGLQWSTLEAPEEQRKLPQKVVVKGKPLETGCR